MKTISKALKYLAAIACAGFVVSNALAISITPTSGDLNLTRWEGNQTGQTDIDTVIGPIIGNTTELFKVEPGESGPLAGSYDGTYNVNSGTITYTDGAVVTPSYLLVKDGNQEPAWYLFNLTALGWNSVETIDLSGFWEGTQGAISHITLYGGGRSTNVPDGGSMLALLGGIVTVLGFLRRKISA